MNKHVIIPISAATAGLVSGFGIGYFVAKTRMEALMELQLQEEIASVKDAFNRGQKAGEYATPESAAAALLDPDAQAAFIRGQALASEISEQGNQDFIAKYVTPFTSKDGESDGEPIELEDDGVVLVGGSVNVFEQAPTLVAGYPNPTDENAPYLITIDQFHQEHDEYDKNSIVYYEGDMALADETEALMLDIVNTVGKDFSKRFGEGSLDENIVYIRNDRLAIDFEIARDPGLYSEKVMGDVPEPEETFVKTPRKSRSRVRDDRDD